MATPRKPRNRSNDDFGFGIVNIENTNISQQSENKNSYMKNGKMIVSGIVMLLGVILALLAVKIVTIDGNELGVKETWSGGVSEEILQPKTYFLFPGWSQTVYTYDAASQVFVMNDKPTALEGKNTIGREKDSYLVQSQEGQDMRISMNLRWRLDPKKLVSIHKTVRQDPEEKIIRPVLMRVVKDEATTMKAIEAYSGEGLVRLQSNIQKALVGAGEGKELSERGIIVENFVIEHIELDPLYIVEIKGKQIATQKTLRSKEEQIAAEAMALVAKATAQAEYNTKLVGAQLLATNQVIEAQAASEKMIIAAKATAQQSILEAEGKQKAMEATAIGTLAMGKAEAQSKELMLKAWAVPGAESFVKVEVSKNIAQATAGVKGYLPEKMTINTFTDNFMKGLEASTGNVVVGPPTK
jgi:regulator of protease activity HflC (stomatin/prohibitin superfamily)